MLSVLYFLKTEGSKQKRGQAKDITDDENRRNLEREAEEEMLCQEQDRQVASLLGRRAAADPGHCSFAHSFLALLSNGTS